MQPQDRDELLEQIAALRRETRSLRRWVVFTALCAGIFLFAPWLAAFIAGGGARLFEALGGSGFLVPVVALLLLFGGAAYVVSNRGSGSSPQSARKPGEV